MAVAEESRILALADLGPTPQAGVRRILDEFRRVGWKDRDGAALAIVRTLQSGGGTLLVTSVARSVPVSFLGRNNLKRVEIVQFLSKLAAPR